MSAKDERVFIIGGGPAGLMASIALARNHIPVLLLDKRPLPADKVCGEGIMPAGLAVLRKLGVDAHIAPGAGRPFHGIRYVSAKGRDARGIFAEGPGLGLSRRELAAALLRRAREFADLEIRDGTPCALEWSRSESRARVRLDGREYFPRLVIGADGLNSPTRKAAGLEAGPSSLKRWGARRHFGVAPWNDVVEVYSRPGIEAYITPTGPREVGAAFLWDSRRFRPEKGGSDLFPSLLNEFPGLREKLADAPVTNAGGAIGPLHRPVRSQTAPGLLLMGDAAGYLDAITGEGLSLAAEQALALEETVVPLLRKPQVGESQRGEAGAMPGKRELRAYQKQYHRITANYYLVTRLMLVLARFPSFFDRVVRALDARPDFFAHMLSVNMGTKGLFALEPGVLLRFLRALLSGRGAVKLETAKPG